MDTTLCEVPSAERAEECAVILEASGIANRLQETPGGWAVVVAARDVARARQALAAYEEENRPRPAPQAAMAEYGRNWAGLGVAALMILGHALTGGREAGSPWFGRGSASAELILKGEVWRAVTALTLHADPVHVLSNAVAGALLITGVVWRVGPGIGLWLVLLAGAGGNVLTAILSGARHISVGASTATFGAVGILAALQVAARRRRPWERRATLVAVGAGLALLAMLGTAPGTDILAHASGLLMGGALGTGAALVLRAPPRRSLQWVLSAAAAAAVLGCWTLALA